MAKGIKVRVRYTGQSHIRIVERYEWNADNGYVQTVTSQAMVDRLLANGDFELVPLSSAPQHSYAGAATTDAAQEKQETK